MNKQQLASKIWALANNLRGRVSAATYKDYILGFLFYKYLSDKEERYLRDSLFFEDADFKELTEEDESTVNNCMNNIGYFISYENLFSTWVWLDSDQNEDKEKDVTIREIRIALSAFNRFVGKNYKRVFDGIFDTLNTALENLGTKDSERTTNSKKIIRLVNSIPTDNKEDYDVLGFIYEYLLKNFAANAGKAGEFYTPHEASVIMAEIIADHLKNKDEISVYDPTSGSGSLLINIGQAVSKYFANKNKVKYFAQELIPETYNLTRMNLVMRDILPSNIVARQGDTLDRDWPYFDVNDPENTYEPLFVDACCSNPPYSQAWDDSNAAVDPRFKDYGTAPKSKADYAFLLHNLYHLNSGGIMTIVLPHGVLFRGGEEGNIRQRLIDKNHIEAIIGLPANMFYGTGIPTIIMVLKKNRAGSDVLFVDASKGFYKDGNKNRLRQRDIRKIVDTVLQKKEIENYSRLVSKEEIKLNEYNLNIPRYVDSNIKEPGYDIYATMFGGIPNSEIDNFKAYWEAFPTLRDQLFQTSDIPYSHIKVEDVKETILKNSDVQIFIKNHNDNFAFLKSYLTNELVQDPSKVDISTEEGIIASKLRERIPDGELIKYYNAYEVLSDNWSVISLDLETIKKESLLSAKAIDDVVTFKKNKTTKELEEKPIGEEGRVIPFSLIQQEYFSTEADEVEKLNNKISELSSAIDELLSSIDPEDKAQLLKEDGDEIDSKKLNGEISKINKELKKGAEFDEGSYQEIILSIGKTKAELKKVKDKAKEASKHLSDETITKLTNLSDEEIRYLLTKKWVLPICDGINGLANKVVSDFEKELIKLSKKYEKTMVDVENDIETTESNLRQMIDELTGDEFDIKGLQEFKKILGENDDE